MKKTLSLILAFLMCLSLCACGGGNNTPETTETPSETTSPQLDIENVIAETPAHIYDDVRENQARAMQNTYMVKCEIRKITNEYFEAGGFRVYLPSEELAKLNMSESVAFIGKITEIIEEKDAYGNIMATWYILNDAQLYDGEFPEVEPREHEIFTGLLRGKNTSYEGAWNIQIGDDPYLKLIYFAECEDLSAFNESSNSGEEITFSSSLSKYQTRIDYFPSAKIIN